MQELIWYIQCYGPWVSGGFFIGFAMATWLVMDHERTRNN